MDKASGDKYREKAALQMLCELLGYDEGRAYYLLLTNQGALFEQEFSHSKRYRITSSLFKTGMMGKVKYSDKNVFQYTLLPVSIFRLTGADLDLLSFLEEVYAKHHKNLFNATFSQWMLKDERGLIIFMLKYIMQDAAQLVSDDSTSFNKAGIDTERITLKPMLRGTRRRFGIIDKSIAFDFSPFAECNSIAAIGYIARASTNKEGCKVKLVERELEEF